jgi:hypothetical protein
MNRIGDKLKLILLFIINIGVEHIGIFSFVFTINIDDGAIGFGGSGGEFRRFDVKIVVVQGEIGF